MLARRLALLLPVVLAGMPVQATAARALGAPTSITGVVGIIPETHALVVRMKNARHSRSHGFSFVRDSLNGRNLALVQCEYGKVSAAAAVMLLLARFRPREVIFIGTAGAVNPDLAQGDVVIGTKTFQHDLYFDPRLHSAVRGRAAARRRPRPFRIYRRETRRHKYTKAIHRDIQDGQNKPN